MRASKPRVLIVYGTSEGHTARIAMALADSLRTAAMDVEVANAAEAPPPADGFNAVIVAASVHAGQYQRSVVRWVRANREALAQTRTAFISVCLAVLSPKPDAQRDLQNQMRAWFAQVGWQPTETKIVAGALPYTRYPWWKRFMMRRIVARQHGDIDTSRDYEYTDWADLAAFVSAFAARVVSTGRPDGERLAS